MFTRLACDSGLVCISQRNEQSRMGCNSGARASREAPDAYFCPLSAALGFFETRDNVVCLCVYCLPVVLLQSPGLAVSSAAATVAGHPSPPTTFSAPNSSRGRPATAPFNTTTAGAAAVGATPTAANNTALAHSPIIPHRIYAAVQGTVGAGAGGAENARPRSGVADGRGDCGASTGGGCSSAFCRDRKRGAQLWNPESSNTPLRPVRRLCTPHHGVSSFFTGNLTSMLPVTARSLGRFLCSVPASLCRD